MSAASSASCSGAAIGGASSSSCLRRISMAGTSATSSRWRWRISPNSALACYRRLSSLSLSQADQCALRARANDQIGRAFMSVLITGGSGFVGLNIAAAVLSKSDHVILYGPDRPPAVAEQYLRGLSGELSIELGDVRDRPQVMRMLETHRCSHVVHGAAI